MVSEESQLPDTLAIEMPRPRAPRPIVVIGAGGIVRAAHLPAYTKAEFQVVGIMDMVTERAASVAKEHGIGASFGSVAEAVKFAPSDAVFDVAVPASQLTAILPQLPDRAAVLMQKPMGETLAEAAAIRKICRDKDLMAAVNFSLRYSPNNLAVRKLDDAGLLGKIHDLEVQTRTYTPWQLWSFLAAAPRLEILYHSIHYFDLIRSWLGNPQRVMAKTVKSPLTAQLAATKTVAILDYGELMRVFVTTNHSHQFGPAHQHSFVQWEGTAGAARISMGLNLDYPKGRPDTAEYAPRGNEESSWKHLPVRGNNSPDAFMGTMGHLQGYVEGSVKTLPTHYEDGYETMRLVEALYESSAQGGLEIATVQAEKQA